MGNTAERDVDDLSALDPSTLLTLLGRAHMVDLLYEVVVADDPPVRFNQLEEALDVSPNTLSRRLEELDEAGFLARRQYDEIPPRVEYEPTEKLYALEPTFRELVAWLEAYGADGEWDFPEL